MKTYRKQAFFFGKMIVRITGCLYHVRSSHQSLRTSTFYITALSKENATTFYVFPFHWCYYLSYCCVLKFPLNCKLLLFSNCFMMGLELRLIIRFWKTTHEIRKCCTKTLSCWDYLFLPHYQTLWQHYRKLGWSIFNILKQKDTFQFGSNVVFT